MNPSPCSAKPICPVKPTPPSLSRQSANSSPPTSSPSLISPPSSSPADPAASPAFASASRPPKDLPKSTRRPSSPSPASRSSPTKPATQPPPSTPAAASSTSATTLPMPPNASLTRDHFLEHAATFGPQLAVCEPSVHALAPAATLVAPPTAARCPPLRPAPPARPRIRRPLTLDGNYLRRSDAEIFSQTAPLPCPKAAHAMSSTQSSTSALASGDLEAVLAIAAASPEAPQWPAAGYTAYLTAAAPAPSAIAFVAESDGEISASPPPRYCSTAIKTAVSSTPWPSIPRLAARASELRSLHAILAWAARNNGARHVCPRSPSRQRRRHPPLPALRPASKKAADPATTLHPEEDAVLLGEPLPPFYPPSFSTDKSH